METNEAIREEIIKIITNFGFWAIVKDYMTGVAGYIKEGRSRVYCEVLFPKEYPEKDAIINFPKKTSVKLLTKLNEILSSDKKMTPTQILNEFREIIKTLPPEGVILEEDLEIEIEKVKKYSKVIPTQDKYLLKVQFESPKTFLYTMELDLSNYPLSIDMKFSHDLEKVIGKPDNLDLIKNWNPNTALEILEIVDYVNKLLKAYNESISDEQKIILRNFTLKVNNKIYINNLNFEIPSGEMIGIYTENPKIIKPFLDCFVGRQHFQGDLKIFNKTIGNKSLNVIFLDFTNDSLINYFNLSQNNTIKSAFDKFKSSKTMTQMINKVISIVQLDTIKKVKIKELHNPQIYRLLLGLSIVTLPDLLIIYKPEYQLNDTEQKRIWSIIKELNEEYFTTMIIYSETKYIRNCNLILIFDKRGNLLDFGTHDKLVSILPTKDIIVLQLNYYSPKDIEKLRYIDGVKFIIEERKHEKYRIFIEGETNKIVKNIFDLFGEKIFNMSKEEPDLIDIIPYLRYKKRLKS